MLIIMRGVFAMLKIVQLNREHYLPVVGGGLARGANVEPNYALRLLGRHSM